MAGSTDSATSTDGHRVRVVVGFDGSEGSEQALDWAAEQAARTDSVLEIHIAHGTRHGADGKAEAQKAMSGVAGLGVVRAEKVAPGLTTRVVTHEGSPADALVAASKDADLLVVGSRGLGGFTGLVLGSVGHSCALHAYCPVVIVRPLASSAVDRQWWPPMRIAVGVDGSHGSVLAVEWAMQEAQLTGAAVVAVTAWSWPQSYGWGAPLPADLDMQGDARTILHQVVDPIRARYPAGELISEVVEGHPAQAMADVSKSADLLVIGSRGHGELAGALLGSVGEYCVTHASCPVVILRSPQSV